MGLPKWDHIRGHYRALMDDPRIAEAWQTVQGSAADAAAVASSRGLCALIPGTAESVEWLRARRIAIGSTTSYTRDIMERVIPVAERRGYRQDCFVCAGDTPQGRPTPLMMYRCFLELAVYPAWACVKVDDTAPGIAEGLAAGCWTIGVSLSGNGVGLSREELDRLAPEEREDPNERARAGLREAGAHLVVDTVPDIPSCMTAIQERLDHGERPA